jgi:hypothetical protein
VRFRRALELAAAAALGPVAVAAQSAPATVGPAQPARYLLTAEAADVRALWVNPAGLALQPGASLGAELTAERSPTGDVQLSEWGAAMSSRGLAAAWVHQRYPDGASLNAYDVGLGLGNEQFSAGAARRWYRGTVRGGTWDAATRWTVWPGVAASLVARDLGSPHMGDSTYWATLVPGAALRLFGGRIALAGEWEVVAHGWRSQAYRVGGSVALTDRIALLVRADLDRSLRRRALAIALDVEAPRGRVSAFGQLSGTATEVDAFGASGALVARTAGYSR